MLTDKDLIILKEKGLSEKDIQNQLQNFIDGFPFLNLKASASIQKGIMTVEDKQLYYQQIWDNYSNQNHRIIKFVPASGAASRMFKNLFEFLETEDSSLPDSIKHFFDNIHKFAFYYDLDSACTKKTGSSIHELITKGDYKTIISTLLKPDGLNYGNLPKGLLKFHKYENGEERTPVEEHLTEGSMYAKNHDGSVNIHFTVSPDHKALFDKLISEKQKPYEEKLDVRYQISFSEQKPKTDTIAADMHNKPFRDKDGSLVFRPGGHGALIENLNDLDGDIIFIKNIDNVVPDKLKTEESKYKKLLAGVLVDTQSKIFEYLNLIDSGDYTHEQLIEILYFAQDILNIKNPEIKFLEDGELVLFLKNKLNRPIRVCGMVKNVGEPGGGPFLAINQDGTSSPQILESSQIDMNDPDKKAMFEKGTHFNPVDLVCAVRNYKGEKFDLTKHVDKNTGFISIKSKNGKELKALELPGLWNGAMSDWNTLFVEVPIETFNPVKTVNDLLRPQHQA